MNIINSNDVFVEKKIVSDKDICRVCDNNIPAPTDLRISTITAVCRTNVNISLSKLIENIDHVLIDTDSNDEGIIKSIYGNILKGHNDSNTKKRKNKCFYNQITNVIRIRKDDHFKEINIKVFNNGNLQLTGLKKKEEGIKCIELLISSINKIYKINPCIITKIDGNTIDYYDFEIVLINSDYSARFKIKRDKLHEVLINHYNIYSSYEPCIYPGVNSKYYWNEDYKNYSNKGVCYCTKQCNGKGMGKGNGNCKKITISTFQSGNVIITGARTFEQINCAYIFINDVFKNNYDYIKRKSIPFIEDNFKNQNQDKKNNSGKSIIHLKKSDIVFKNQKIFINFNAK